MSRPDPGPVVGVRALVRQLLPPPGQIRIASVVAFLTSMAILGAVSFAPLALTDIRGLSSLETGITIALLSITWSAATFLQGRMPHVPAARIARLGLVLLVAGLPVVALSAVPAVPLPATWVGWVVSGFGAGFTFQAANLHVMAHATRGEEGRATAAPQFMGTLGNGVGTWLGGVLLASALGAGMALGGALAWVFAMCTGAAVAGLVASLRLSRTSVPARSAG
jgi:hypothetical protein